MMEPIKVIIADDHPLFRKGLVTALEGFKNLQIVNEASNGKELLSVLAKTSCDVVLLDLKMPTLDGIAAAPLILEGFPNVKIIVLTMLDEEQFIIHLIKIGVHGYLLKNAEPEIVVHTIEEVVKHGTFFDHKTVQIMHKGLTKKQYRPASVSPQVYFSERDLEVLQLVCKDFTKAEIAEKLCISPRTVEYYRVKLIEKTNSKNIAGVVAYAFKHKIVEF
jgi:two-component system, NarL family, response regulator DegU